MLAIHARQIGYKGVSSWNLAKLTLRSNSFITNSFWKATSSSTGTLRLRRRISCGLISLKHSNYFISVHSEYQSYEKKIFWLLNLKLTSKANTNLTKYIYQYCQNTQSQNKAIGLLDTTFLQRRWYLPSKKTIRHSEYTIVHSLTKLNDLFMSILPRWNCIKPWKHSNIVEQSDLWTIQIIITC